MPDTRRGAGVFAERYGSSKKLVGVPDHLARRSKMPLASTLNAPDGRVKAAAAIVQAGTQGAVSVYTTGATELILDISGYFVPVTDDMPHWPFILFDPAGLLIPGSVSASLVLRRSRAGSSEPSRSKPRVAACPHPLVPIP